MHRRGINESQHLYTNDVDGDKGGTIMRFTYSKIGNKVRWWYLSDGSLSFAFNTASISPKAYYMHKIYIHKEKSSLLANSPPI